MNAQTNPIVAPLFRLVMSRHVRSPSNRRRPRSENLDCVVRFGKEVVLMSELSGSKLDEVAANAQYLRSATGKLEVCAFISL